MNKLEQWGFYFDQSRCVNCKSCVLACKSWNEDKRGDAKITPELTWLKTGMYEEPNEYDNLPGSSGELNFKEYRKYYMKENWRRTYTNEYGDAPPNVDVLNLSISCNHCDNPVCIEVCPTKCIYKEDEFGIVLIDTTKTCIACKRCKKACPWDSPQYYDENIEKYAPSDPERPRMTKCNLCIDRIKEGLKPSCVAACPMRALDAGPIEELKQLHPDWEEKVDNFPDGNVSGLSNGMNPNIIFKKKARRF